MDCRRRWTRQELQRKRSGPYAGMARASAEVPEGTRGRGRARRRTVIVVRTTGVHVPAAMQKAARSLARRLPLCWDTGAVALELRQGGEQRGHRSRLCPAVGPAAQA